MKDWTSEPCVPCRKGAPPLTEEEVGRLLPDVPGWRLVEEGSAPPHLTRTLGFASFREAMSFVNRVADLAEREGHHPDIQIHWNEVRLDLWTHAIGGLHRNDFLLAGKIDRLAEVDGVGENAKAP